MNPEEAVCERRLHLAGADRDKWLDIVSAVMNRWVP
jgi:hypothetical protein